MGLTPDQVLDVPRWSSDGASLVVGIDRFDDAGNETGSMIATVPAAGDRQLKPLTEFDSYTYYPDWNRTTNAIVFSTETIQFAGASKQTAAWDLYQILPDGTDQRQITHVDAGTHLWQPSWTPDGTTIIATRDGQGKRVAVTIDPANGAVSQLTGGLATHTRLQPNG